METKTIRMLQYSSTFVESIPVSHQAKGNDLSQKLLQRRIKEYSTYLNIDTMDNLSHFQIGKLKT